MSPSSSSRSFVLDLFGRRRRGDRNDDRMGCAQGKPSRGSPARSDDGPRGGLDRLMRDNAYRPASASGTTTSRQLSDPLPVTAERTPAAATKEAAGAGTTTEKTTTPDDDDDDAARRCPAARVSTTPPLPPPRRDNNNEQLVDGWPTWLLDNVPREALHGIVPKSADAYDKIEKVGQGTYSNVYKARERGTGRIVALKKVRFDTSESESVRFMAREIRILQRLDHPNVIRLEGIATSRMHRSIYLVFDFMYSDLARIIIARGDLTEPQIKCYMQQLLSGLQHCHERGVLHRDIKGSNLLIDRHGVLKIGDFGLANYYGGRRGRPLTSRVVTLWYRAPELLLGSTDYGVGIDLWSAGCLLAEMFFAKPLMPGRTEIEQLYRIFSLCGSPPDDYWRKQKVSATYRPTKVYKSTMAERLRELPPSAGRLITTLLALDPAARATAAHALHSDFFSTPPLPCDVSSLPVVYKEEEVADPCTSHDGRPKLRQRSHRRKDTRPKPEEQQQADEPKNNDNNGSSPNKEENRVTDAAKSDFGVEESPGHATVTASSPNTIPKRFSIGPVQVLPAQPQESKPSPAAPQDQPLPTASRHRFHRSSSGSAGNDEDREDGRQPLPASPDGDHADGEPSFVVLDDRSPEHSRRMDSVTDYDAAVATLRGSGELTSKQCVVVDHA